METYILVAILTAIASVSVGRRWKDIITGLAGKRIAVIGASASGKTTLFTFLGMLHHDSIKVTRTPSKTGIGGIQLRDGDKVVYFRCKSSRDMPGDEENRNLYWKQLIEESDSVLYLVHASRLLLGEDEEIQAKIKNAKECLQGKQLEAKLEKVKNESKKIQEETKKRIKDDFRVIKQILKEDMSKVIIIGNHFDEVDTKFYDEIHTHQEIFKEYLNNQVFLNEKNETDTKLEVIDKTIGSFKSCESVEKVMNDVYKIIKAKEDPLIKKIICYFVRK